MQMSSFKKMGKRLLQIGVPLLVLLLIAYSIQSQWHQLMDHQFELHPWFLALAFLGFLLQELSYGLIWRSVLSRMGFRLDLRSCLRIYLASEFVRYIPGNVWHVLARILWAGKYGVPRPVAFASMMIELITKLAAGALIFAVSLFFWGDVRGVSQLINGSPIIIVLAVLTFGSLLVLLHPRILNGCLNTALRLLKRNPVALTLRYQDILFVTSGWCVSWLIAGTAFYLLLLALWPATPFVALPICIGIYAFVWDIGFLSIITPGGLGVREGAVILIFALAFPLPAGLSGIIAILSRLVSTLAELLCVGLAYASGGRQLRAIQEEELAQSPILKAENSEMSTTIIASSIAMSGKSGGESD